MHLIVRYERDVISMMANYDDESQLSLGVDTFESDPITAFKLTTECYTEIGRIIRGLSRPTLFVLEG